VDNKLISVVERIIRTLNLCLAGAPQGEAVVVPQFKGQDFNAEFHLDLKEVYTTHKRTLTVNGKNIRLTIPAGVENGQVIKITGYGAAGSGGGPKGFIHNFHHRQSHCF
jgi:DnaJ-class molecular chaperone